MSMISVLLIATSLADGSAISRRVINLYRTRMQIEESFRDLKNSRWGFSLDEARVSRASRYENLLLIGMLATLAVWLSGKVVELSAQHRRYQANTVKHRKVLSTFFLGTRVLRQANIRLSQQEYQRALIALTQQFSAQCEV